MFITGTICGDSVVQQRRDETGQLMFDAEGYPRLCLVIPLQTDERADDTDTGIRALYVFGRIKFAIRDAVLKSGAKGLEVGGRITVDSDDVQYAPPT